MQARYRVTLREYERGWGSKHWSDTDFLTLKEAEEFRDKENAKNTSPTAPDWYVQAGDPYLVDIDINPPRK
jgi:hypothetical protein